MQKHKLAGALALSYCAAGVLPGQVWAQAQGAVTELESIRVEASADASAEGLAPAYAGGQVATGARAGILGTRDSMALPFSVTSYTNALIQDRNAHSVGDVLQNDPGIRVARGFGNFQESYFMRGFILGSDDVAYNGLYGLLPRQYIATELFERVEVLRGASAFLTGASPTGGGIGGVINLVPKRAPNDPLTRVTAGWSSDAMGQGAVDIARRFGPDDRVGVRLNVGHRNGETGIDDARSRTSVGAIGVDWRGDRLRLSADLGWQDNRLKRPRPNVTLGAAVTQVPSAPDARRNYAQPWTYSNERDVFGTLRGEYDFNDKVTAWGAYGRRYTKEDNSLANITLTNGATGAGTYSRFDNTREDTVDTGELGLRAKLQTGAIGHEVVLAGSFFELDKKNAYASDSRNPFTTNIHDPVFRDRPDWSSTAVFGNQLSDPALNGRTRMQSVALGDTLSLFDEQLLVTLGVRHQRLYSRNYAYNTGAPGAAYKQSRNSPAAGIVWRVAPQVSLYANYIESLAQGGTAPITQGGLPVVNGGEMLSPYVSKQKEVGVKYDSGDLGAGLAYFTTDKPSAYVNAARVFEEAGKDRHQGLELTVYGQAARDLRVLGGLTWLDAEQKATGNAATEGRRVIGVPRWQGTLGLEWDVPGVDGLALDGRVVYTGASYANAANTLEVPGWTRFDAGLRYMTTMGDSVVTWRARVENIANRDYWSSVGGFPGSGYLVLGSPRTFSLTASVEF